MLVKLLRFLLFGGPNPCADRILSDEEWAALASEAKREGVTALTYDAILQLTKEQRPTRRILFQFTSRTQTIETDNTCLDNALHDLAELVYGEIGLKLTVVKGFSLARLYPNPLHRERGDNDLYTGVDTERVCEIVERMGIEVDRLNPRHAAFKYKGSVFECHRNLLYHNDDPKWELMSQQINNSTAQQLNNSTPITRLIPEQEAYFLAKHTDYHATFFNEPVRLRTLIDWHLLIDSPGFDYDRFRQIKRSSDVDIFADLMTAYSGLILGAYRVSPSLASGCDPEDFRLLFIDCPTWHPKAIVRVLRRSWHYLRYNRKFRAVYGCSMFRRFYLRNLLRAII